MFITLEGIEGSGKTSQLGRLEAYFRKRGADPLVTREPGGTAVGQKIRAILLDPANDGLSDRAELLLYLADRAQHLETVVKPALKAGRTVICDRYVDATAAYQGAARGMGTHLVFELHRLLFDDLKPELTLLLDVAPPVGLARAWRQLGSGERPAEEGRFEQQALAFHERVRQGYLDLARREPRRFGVIDATADEQAVWEAIRETLERYLAGR